jgi:hypothetical protein
MQIKGYAGMYCQQIPQSSKLPSFIYNCMYLNLFFFLTILRANRLGKWPPANGPVPLAPRDDWDGDRIASGESMYAIGNLKTCNLFLIFKPQYPNQRIELSFKRLSFPCKDACISFLEVKYKLDKVSTGKKDKYLDIPRC